jgi:AcrR family transcriptional regulator
LPPQAIEQSFKYVIDSLQRRGDDVNAKLDDRSDRRVMTTATALLPEAPEWSDARRRLFETAIVLFGERGVHGVSVRDLMGALGQQPGALYGHVASKQQLLYELVRVGYEEHRRWLRDALLDAGSDPVDQVRALTRAHVLVHLTYQALAKVTTRESRALVEEQREELMTVLHESERMFLDVIERGERLGVLHVEEPARAVAAIAAMGVRAAERYTADLGFSPEEIATTYADYAVKILS